MRRPISGKITGIILTFYFLSFSIVSGPKYISIRSMGMGNVSVATVKDRTAIFNNPAGLSTLKNVIDFTVSPLILSADGKFITLIEELKDHKNKLADISQIDENFIDMLNEMDGRWVGVQYLPEITFATDNMGFGIYSTFPVNVRIESGHFIPKLVLRGERNLAFTWAVGIPLKNTSNHCGISIEYLQRTPLKETITTYSETFIYFDKVASSKALGVLGDLSDIKHGVSFDVSFLHDFKKFEGFRMAYNLQDALGVIGGKIVFPPNFTFGCSYLFPQMDKIKLIDNLILAFEISDIFGLESESKKYGHFAKKLHAGVELDLHYGMLRMGINQGYFTTGLGVRFGLFFLDYAFFTEEMGYYPGQLPNKKHILSMGLNIRSDRKTQKSGEEPVDKNQDVIQKITVEKPPVGSESREINNKEGNQNPYEDVLEIEDDEIDRPEVERSETEDTSDDIDDIIEEIIESISEEENNNWE